MQAKENGRKGKSFGLSYTQEKCKYSWYRILKKGKRNKKKEKNDVKSDIS